jgi:tRNA(fMet)-specific endonuclease VapC
MTTFPVLLDTDMLSAIMRQHPTVTPRASAYLGVHSQFMFSIVTQYEILRGLKAKQATMQQLAFHRFCDISAILPLTEAIIVRASDIYADLYRRGELIGDADILIAATALEVGYGLVTNNSRHFGRIVGLPLENWLGP